MSHLVAAPWQVPKKYASSQVGWADMCRLPAWPRFSQELPPTWRLLLEGGLQRSLSEERRVHPQGCQLWLEGAIFKLQQPQLRC